MTNPVAPAAHYRSQRSQRALQVRIGLTALACVLYVGMQLRAAWLWLGFGPRYVLTEDGRDAIRAQHEEISLEDWARAPVCDLCGRFSPFGLPHAKCIGLGAWPVDRADAVCPA